MCMCRWMYVRGREMHESVESSIRMQYGLSLSLSLSLSTLDSRRLFDNHPRVSRGSEMSAMSNQADRNVSVIAFNFSFQRLFAAAHFSHFFSSFSFFLLYESRGIHKNFNENSFLQMLIHFHFSTSLWSCAIIAKRASAILNLIHQKRNWKKKNRIKILSIYTSWRKAQLYLFNPHFRTLHFFLEYPRVYANEYLKFIYNFIIRLVNSHFDMAI